MKISAVICARNDDYGGNLVERASFCLASFVNSVDEVIYVDWNSPDNDSLFNHLEFKGKDKVTHIQVTKELHSRLVPKEAQGVVEVLARNVGIRRASGDYIISSNIDIIAPTRTQLEELILEHPNNFVTVARRDLSLDKTFELYKESGYSISKLQIMLDHYSASINPHGYSGICKEDTWSKIDCCGDFQFANKNIWYEIKGFEEGMIGRGYSDSNVQKKAILAGFEVVPSFTVPIYHISHGGGFGGGKGLINNGDQWVMRFSQSLNKDTWGLSNETL